MVKLTRISTSNGKKPRGQSGKPTKGAPCKMFTDFKSGRKIKELCLFIAAVFALDQLVVITFEVKNLNATASATSKTPTTTTTENVTTAAAATIKAATTTATVIATTKVAAAAEIINNTGIEDIDSFFYIHTPKTGTSLYTVLRNRLKSCKVKDFTCFGVSGGGMWGAQSKDGKDHFPYSAKSLGIKDGEREASCGKTLNCPSHSGTPYHCQYSNPICQKQRNKVTMFRDPQKWFKSLLDPKRTKIVNPRIH